MFAQPCTCIRHQRLFSYSPLLLFSFPPFISFRQPSHPRSSLRTPPPPTPSPTGAGKSTALKILTGDELASTGAAYLGGFDVASQPEAVRRLMGYCPQVLVWVSALK